VAIEHASAEVAKDKSGRVVLAECIKPLTTDAEFCNAAVRPCGSYFSFAQGSSCNSITRKGCTQGCETLS
jgi:hypothetical protein